MTTNTINFTPETTSLTTNERGKEVFLVNRKDENNVIFRKEIQSPALVKALSTMEILTYAHKISTKGMVIQIGLLDRETLKKEGFKSVSDAVLSCDFGNEYDANTINRYRRIGRAFGIIDADGRYKWYGISQDVTVNNISAIMKLINFPDKFEDATIEELHSCVDEFIENYIDTDRIHLSQGQKDLREEVRKLNNVIMDTTSEEIKDEKSNENSAENGDGEVEITPEVEETDRINESISMIDYLRITFKGNKKALDMLAKLADMLEK